jgi:hypothetical protein
MKSNNLSFIFCILIASVASFLSLIVSSQFPGDKKVSAQNSDVRSNFKISSWNVVDSSLSDLLNSGWKLVSQSSHRVATVTTNGVGAIEETTYVYTLSKGSKYITCFLNSPVANKGAYSGCRSIN